MTKKKYDKEEINQISSKIKNALLSETTSTKKVCAESDSPLHPSSYSQPFCLTTNHPVLYFLHWEVEEGKTYYDCMCLNCGEVFNLKSNNVNLDQLIFLKDKNGQIMRSNYSYQTLIKVYQACKELSPSDELNVQKILKK